MRSACRRRGDGGKERVASEWRLIISTRQIRNLDRIDPRLDSIVAANKAQNSFEGCCLSAPTATQMSAHPHSNYKIKKQSTSGTWKKPSGRSWPTHPDWPDGVTIGLRVQYTGSKAAQFPQQHGLVEVPADLLREVRGDITAVKLGTASPKTGNAHFSTRLPGGIDLVWPAYKVRHTRISN